jgi:hypothetical protein
MSLLHQRPKPTLMQRLKLWAARRRHEPHRKTDIYARLRQIGAWGLNDKRPTIKPVPQNLRYFSRTVHAARAISLYTKPISNLDWHVTPREGVKENSEIKRQIELVTACLQSPNNDDSLVTLLQQIVEDICVCGAGSIEQQIGGDKSRPLWLWPVDSLSIQIYAGWNGEADQPRYCQTMGYGNTGVAQGRDLLNRDLIYMRDRPTTDTPFSFGMLEIAFASINRLLGVADFAGNLAANAHPENLIFIKGAAQNEIEAFRTYWRNEIEGQGNTPVAGGDDVKAVQLRGADDAALFLKYQEFIIREIATAFGCSPQNFGIEADVNRNTSEVAEDRDWDLGIKPMAKMIAQHVTREAIHGLLGFSQIELTPGGLDREDEKASAEQYKIEYEGNAIIPNEYRARRNLPPLKSHWGEMTYAEMQIAIKGAQGAKAINPHIVDQE